MNNKDQWTISYKQIGLIIFSFSLGVISALLVSNTQGVTTTSFSTTELIGFVLSVILSGASIVLAISAIALGKSSEQSVIKRSDESIRLQNEVFIKTNEALQKIKASTGITEKRIEDIIAGRVGDVSQKIAGLASEGVDSSIQNRKELEEEIKSTLMKAIKGQAEYNVNYDPEKTKERKLREENYKASHNAVLNYVQSIEGIKVGKIGHGTISKKGDDQIDAIFFLSERRIGVSTFRSDAEDKIIEKYLRGAAMQIESGNFTEIVVFSIDGIDFDERVTALLMPFKDELKSQIRFKKLDSTNLDASLIQRTISNNSIQSTAEASAD